MDQASNVRKRSGRIAPYSWLGVGAVGLGVGAALAGAAVNEVMMGPASGEPPEASD